MNDLFDIRILTSSEEIPFSIDNEGIVYIVGDRDSLSDKVGVIQNTIISALDPSTSCLSYRVEIAEQSHEFVDKWGWNLICRIKDPGSEKDLYIVGSFGEDDLEYAVSAVINEAENQMHKFVEEALVIAALGNPEEFKTVVDKIIIDSNADDTPTSRGHGTHLGKVVGSVFSESLGAILGLECAINSDGNSLDNKEGTHEAALGIQKNDKEKSHFIKVSAKDRKDAFRNLPDKLTEVFLKDNRKTAAIVDETLSNLSAEECRALIKELSKKHRNLLRGVYDTTLQGVTRYGLVLHPWDIKHSKDFKKRYNYRYFLYLRDSKGNESPILFKHNPSYCIYVMYMLDRYNRNENVTDISIKSMEKEFISVYKTIINESDEKIRDLFNGMISRTSSNGNVREGRYGEYIKDIHTTLESMMDNVNSIPFKVGFGRYLQVPPEKMTIPNSLAKLKMVAQ